MWINENNEEKKRELTCAQLYAMNNIVKKLAEESKKY
jgi:hypothetical protein